MTAVLFFLAGVIGLPVAAGAGVWHRGMYFAVAVMGGLMAAVFGQLPVGQGAATASADDVTMALLSLGIGSAIGGVLGACVYRAKKPQAVALPNAPAIGFKNPSQAVAGNPPANDIG